MSSDKYNAFLAQVKAGAQIHRRGIPDGQPPLGEIPPATVERDGRHRIVRNKNQFGAAEVPSGQIESGDLPAMEIFSGEITPTPPYAPFAKNCSPSRCK